MDTPTCNCCGEPLSQLSLIAVAWPMCAECLELEKIFFTEIAPTIEAFPLAEVAV